MSATPDNTATGTVRLHRVLRAPPERVYKAFLDPDAMARWLPPYGFTGKAHSFGGKYLEMVPNEKLRYTDVFDDTNLPGTMITTITLKKVMCGTELTATQEGIPAAIPAEMCYLGWQESLAQLAHLVEPEIPDGA